MRNGNMHAAILAAAIAISWLGLFVYIGLLVKWRKPEFPTRALLFGSPAWLLRPRDYFRESGAKYVWPGLIGWAVVSAGLILLVERL